MNKELKLLIIEEKAAASENDPGIRLARNNAMSVANSSISKIKHDSGSRLLVIEATDAEMKEIKKQLPDAKIVPLNSRFSGNVEGLQLNSTERIFLDALKIRTSTKYRKQKEQREYGETAEEKQLLKGSCLRDSY